MAARLNNRHQESVKAKIQASQLINRVQNHALGELELSQTQLDACKFLLNKIISNAPIEQYTEVNNVDGYKFLVERAGSETNSSQPN